MARMIANRPTGRIRGKEECGPRKPKERGNKPNEPTWPANPWNEKEMARMGTQWAIQIKALVWTMPVPRKVMQAQKLTHASRCRRQTLPSMCGRRIRRRNDKNGVGMKEDKPRW